ncbi:hypothetical protein [Aliikangiella maris]|uniref:MSHA biogenesis protein MshJ n=2 Tax=Aliikangiella maris TaxID=3162458 RepID=A0ABV3MQC7_9GAMM
MKDKLIGLSHQFDQQPVRMRLLISLSALLLVYLTFDLLWFADNSSKSKQLTQSNQQIDQQIAQFNQNQIEISAGIYNQQNDPKRKELDTINGQIDSVKQSLEQRAISLVRPNAVPQLLKEILSQSQRLKLISIEKHAPIALFESTQTTANKNTSTQNVSVNNNQSNQQNQVQMFIHPFSLTFTGNFKDTQQFLFQLENMDKKVTFERIEYLVDNYPNSIIKLELSTLNLDRKWIGG